MRVSKLYQVLILFILVVLTSSCGAGGGGGGGGSATVNIGDNPGGNTQLLKATAGPDQNVSSGSLVTLNGSDSTVAKGKLITFRWSFASVPAGSTATFSPEATVVNPSFIANVPGEYSIVLVVNDGVSDSQADMVIIIASVGNSSPVANTGKDLNVSTSSKVTLDGSGSSDANGDLLTYQWTLTSVPAGSTASLSGAGTVSP
ncbi:MAG: PKD domain-containing protein, partial [Patescibacteria group bacterium]|nr:PKD domain-containing protein [Patescibacteria group bacterium]